MFDNLRRAFKEAVDNFKDEIGRDEVPEAVDRLLGGMKQQAADAKVYLRGLEADLAAAEKAIGVESSEAATCRRRESMAQKIGDADTARVAREFAEKHERRIEVLRGKAAALREEIGVRRAEIEEMIEKIKEARAQRDSLSASTGRTQARESMGRADDLFAELDRMAEKIGDEQAAADAAEDLGRDLDPDLTVDLDEPAPPRVDVDDRLEELKRRMGRE